MRSARRRPRLPPRRPSDAAPDRLAEVQLFYERTQRVRAGAFDLHCQEMIGTRPTEIDCRDGFAGLVGPLAEAISRINHERGADDEYGVRLLECANRGIDAMLWNAFPEKYDIGF